MNITKAITSDIEMMAFVFLLFDISAKMFLDNSVKFGFFIIKFDSYLSSSATLNKNSTYIVLADSGSNDIANFTEKIKKDLT